MRRNPKNTKISASKGGSRTPSSVMGSQGKPAKVVGSHFKNKKTKHTKFPQ